MTTPSDTHSTLSPTNSHFVLSPDSLREHPSDDDDAHDEIDFDRSDGDTASQKSISLSSPGPSPRRTSIHLDTAFGDQQQHAQDSVTPVTMVRQGLSNRVSTTYTLETDNSSEQDGDLDDRSSFMRRLGDAESPASSPAQSLKEVQVEKPTVAELEVKEELPESVMKKSLVDSPAESPALSSPMTYPPPPLQKPDPRESVASFASGSTTYSKKARPESMLVKHEGPLILGIALVDFNHLVGPKIEFSRGDIFEEEELAKILPFLALPDGAHLTVEDYSYFHLVPTSPNPSTVFGISCNRQIRSADLLVKDQDVTRSTVQKAVVVLASKPVFGPIRDRLGVITRALFAQRDFSDMSILDEFHSSLETSLKSQLTESGLYMGTSLRELVHTFRQRTLVLVKALMLQKKIMFYGHPVEKLCTFQYSLVTLVPGLLQNLDDCGSPPLANRAKSLSRPTELRTSDPKSVMAFVGLPLDLFGKDSFFQPYLPLQQLDMLKDTGSWLCGSTNSIVTQQKEVDLLVNIETGAFEFRDPTLERLAGLTPADRKWMDEVVKDVNDSWDENDPTGTPNIQFKGSDDYLRQKFDEYITGALSCVKYSEFTNKSGANGVIISDGSGNPDAIQDFNLLWIAEFKKSNAYEVWNRVTDPLLFDIVEPRHPCNERPSVVADIGLRLSEGIQELKLDQQLAPAREAVSRTLTAGSTGFFNAVAGVRGRWMQRSASSSSGADASSSTSSSTVEVSKSDASSVASPNNSPQPPAARPSGIRPLSLIGSSTTIPQQPPPPLPEKPVVNSWGSGISSFFSQRAARFSVPKPQGASPPPAREASPAPSLRSTRSGTNSMGPADLGIDELQPKNLDEAKTPVARQPPTNPTTTTAGGAPASVMDHGPTKDGRRVSIESHMTAMSLKSDDQAGTGYAM